MMISEQNMTEWAEKYLRNELSASELSELQQSLQANPALHASWKETISLMRLLQSQADRRRIKAQLAGLREEETTERTPITETDNVKPLTTLRRYGKVAGIAAALILATSLSTLWLANHKSEKAGAQYMLLRREIETIKHSQSKIFDSLRQNNIPSENAETALFGGTGFALTNDGYVATNYHVVKDADAIYVQTAGSENMKAYLVAFEPNADVAILKIEDKSFSFGKGALPYSLSKSPSGLGQKVFTVGYPREELVYNEGYISCENGYRGDSTSYQLEMTANPGQSGAPVIDAQGNIVALVTGKQSNTSGTTFAVHADAVLQLIHTLPKDSQFHVSNDNRLRGLDRTTQVKKLRPFICAVKVN